MSAASPGAPPTPNAPLCTHVRSTLLVGSLKALRARGHAERYKRLADAEIYDLLFTTGAPTWFPLSVAEAHYAACDALSLPTDEILQVGALVAPVHTSGIDVVLRAARAGGVTPWTVLNNVQRYWARMYDGSVITSTPQGPKDALVKVWAQPLARSPYWRTGLRGIMVALTSALASKAYVHELKADARDRAAYSIAWA